MEPRGRKTLPLKVVNSSFLLAKVQLDHLLCSRKNPRQIRQLLTSLPVDLKDAYQKVIARIEENQTISTAVKVLSWIYHAPRPLAISEVREALVVEHDDTEFMTEDMIDPLSLLESCEGLVVATPLSPASRLRFSHFTVKEFLSKELSRRLLPKGSLGKTCLTYLNFELRNYRPPVSGRDSTFGALSMLAGTCWAMFIRGEGETDVSTRKLVFDMLTSSSKRQTITRVVDRGFEPFVWLDPEFGSALHFLATFGLDVLCGYFLESGMYQEDEIHSRVIVLKPKLITREPICWSMSTFGTATVQPPYTVVLVTAMTKSSGFC
jgi:hypothetical protein